MPTQPAISQLPRTMSLLILGIVIGSSANFAVAQDKPPLRTKVSVELLSSRAANGVFAQEWGRTFQKFGVSVRVRRGTKLNKPTINEKMVGSTRWVTVVGLLNSRGQIAFHDRTFNSQNESEKISQWLKDLTAYGSQGNPDGQPLWGLNKSQFDTIYKQLTSKNKLSVKDLNIRRAIPRLQLPRELPVRFTPASLKWLASEFPSGAIVRQEYTGFSQASSMAMMLNDFGLGFRPRRRPDKSIELVIDPLKDYEDVWPIGWELKEKRTKVAPALFELIPVDLTNIGVVDVMETISEQVQVPVRFDFYRIEGDGIELEEATFSFPKRKSTAIRVMQSAATRHRMAARLVMDELGHPFIWVTTGRAERARITKLNKNQ